MASSRDLQALIGSDRAVPSLVSTYERAIQRVVNEMVSGVSRPGGARAAELVRRINDIVDNLDPRKASVIRSWIRREIPRAFVLGDRAATRDLRRQLEAANAEQRGSFGNVKTTFAPVSHTAVRGIVAATEATLGSAAAQFRAVVGTVIRQTQVTLVQSRLIREATTSGIIRGATGQQVSDDIASILLRGKISPEVRARLASRGFSGELFNSFERVARGQVIQVGRARMNVRAYADLVARTQMREAHTIGTVVRLQQNGVDHVRVSRHIQDEPDECTPYAGNVYYVGPLPKDPAGFPRLSSIVNGGPPFHPNCKHVIEPFVVAIETPRAVSKALADSTLLPRRFYGKTGSEVRGLVAELRASELRDVAPKGADDLRPPEAA